MPDVVTDRLTAFPPGTVGWQNDADAGDTNEPADGDLMTATSTTALAGNLRRLKSEVRGLSIDGAWITYLGLSTPESPSANNAAIVGPTTFNVVNDNPARTVQWEQIAQPGRRVRVTFTDAAPVVATIVDTSVTGTTVTVILEAGTDIAVGTLAYVSFSALGSASGALSTGQKPQLNAFPLDLLPVGSGSATRFVVPASEGGTGQGSGAWGGDLSPVGAFTAANPTFPPMSPSVNFLQGFALDAQPITGGDQVLHWDVGGTIWKAANLGTLAGLGPLSGDGRQGTLSLPNTSMPLYLKWTSFLSFNFPAQQLDGTIGPFAWDTPFPGFSWFVWVWAVDPRVVLTWDNQDATANVGMRFRNLSAISQTASPVVFAPSTPGDAVAYGTNASDIIAVVCDVWALAIGQ